MTTNLPPRLAVDADGFVWRVYDDGTWSMAPTNPDNDPVPQPVTFYVPLPEPEPGTLASLAAAAPRLPWNVVAAGDPDLARHQQDPS